MCDRGLVEYRGELKTFEVSRVNANLPEQFRGSYVGAKASK